MKYILILGATSDIGKAIAKVYAQHGYHLILTARNTNHLLSLKKELEDQYMIAIQLETFDVLQTTIHQSFFDSLKIKPYGVVYCIGYLGNQELAQKELTEANLILQTNYTASIPILSIIAQYLESLKQGFIIGISSVAGDRGRGSNYFYGSAKAGFTAFLSGLRARLAKNNVHVLTVKPGFVYTKMTAHLSLPQVLTIAPTPLAHSIFKAQQKKKNVIYVKWFWRYIMWIIKLIPEFIFKKLNL